MPVRPGGATDPASRIEAVVDRQDRRFQRAFRQAIQIIKDSWTLDALADLLEQGRFEEAVATLDAAAALMGNTYGAVLVDSAQDAARFLSGALTVTVAFDGSNVRAVQAIQANRLRWIREFTAEQRTVLRQALASGIEQGLNPRDQARLFRDSVGLTARQERAVANYRRLLTTARADNLPSLQAIDRELRDGRSDKSIRRAIRDGTPLPAGQVDRMVDRYRNNYIRYRAEVIGRTEALRSAHQGNEEMYQQAIDDGQIEPQKLVRRWVTASDERVRSSHSSLNGVKKPLGESWQGFNGELRYPGDPDAPASETVQCRCAISTRIDP